MDKIHYRTGNHCCYRIMYHIVRCPKFRFSVLNDEYPSVNRLPTDKSAVRRRQED